MDPTFDGPQSLPDAEEIRWTAQDVLSHPDYDLDSTRYDLSPLFDWIENVLAPVFRPIGDAFDALSDISPALAWTIFILLLILLITLTVHIVYTLVQAIRPTAGQLMPEFKVDQAHISPEAWENKARQAAETGDFTEAGRYLLRACLLWLKQTRRKPIRRGMTNREYLYLFRRTPVREALGHMVDIVDVRWYAGGIFSQADYQECSAAHITIRQWAEVNQHADDS